MSDKAKESVHLMKKIQDLGISPLDPTYLEVKDLLNVWIKSEEQKSSEHELFFARYGRRAKLSLPWKADVFCGFYMLKNPGHR
jgi:hypothetical protein